MASLSVESEGLSHYYGDRAVLKAVSFTLHEGQTVAVVGPNGAGKSTLLKILATLLQPSSGKAAIFGCNLKNESNRIRADVGYLGHNSLLYRELSALENLTFYAKLYGLNDASERALELLRCVELEHRRDDPICNLSRGMVQRIACCRAVINRPRLLLLDEPHSHLDLRASDLIEPLIGRSTGLTRVLVTHEFERGLGEADLVLALRAGRVVVSKSSKDIAIDELKRTVTTEVTN